SRRSSIAVPSSSESTAFTRRGTRRASCVSALWISCSSRTNSSCSPGDCLRNDATGRRLALPRPALRADDRPEARRAPFAAVPAPRRAALPDLPRPAPLFAELRAVPLPESRLVAPLEAPREAVFEAARVELFDLRVTDFPALLRVDDLRDLLFFAAMCISPAGSAISQTCSGACQANCRSRSLQLYVGPD